VLAGTTEGRITFIACASKAAVERGFHSGDIIREITKLAGGSGGGKPDMAQGGGKESLADALAAAAKLAESQICQRGPRVEIQ
jgi:alanyl-tRNA synthetase